MDSKLTFTVYRATWLQSQWPALVFWPGVTLGLLAGMVTAVALSGWLCWLLFIPLIWWFSGNVTVSLIVLMVRGRATATVWFRETGAVGVSSDERRSWTPIDRPRLEDQGDHWVLSGLNGVIIPISKRALDERSTGELLRRVPPVPGPQRLA